MHYPHNSKTLKNFSNRQSPLDNALQNQINPIAKTSSRTTTAVNTPHKLILPSGIASIWPQKQRNSRQFLL